MGASGYLRITRPVNAVVSGLAALLGSLIATGTVTPVALLLPCVVALITAAGNTVNDYFDQDIDLINRPDRPIPSGAVSPVAARSLAGALFASGIFISIFTGMLCFAIASFNAVLLVLYAARLKRTPLLGNIAVSYLSASIFIFGGAFTGFDGIIQNIPLAGITFLAMLAREVLKDAEDIEGDSSAGAVTLPLLIGVRRTVQVACICASGAVVVSLLPIGRWWGHLYLAGIGVVDLIILGGALKAVRCRDPGCVTRSSGSAIMKAGMFAALVVFTLAAVIVKP